MKRPAGKTLDAFHAKWSKDPDYLQAYEGLEEEFGIAEALITARAKAGLTQEQLAERLGKKQSAVARLEAGAKDPKLSTLGDYAAATGVGFHIRPDVMGTGFRVTLSDRAPVGSRRATARVGRHTKPARKAGTKKA